ncbi:peptidoglycan-binding protein [Salinispora arenicola]|nr:peptidoglycan-binding protein [Salinispora arenicola]
MRTPPRGPVLTGKRPAGKGRRYLRPSGAGGLYGPEYRELIKAFRADQGLTRDGLLGRKTWDAAYRTRFDSPLGDPRWRCCS